MLKSFTYEAIHVGIIPIPAIIINFRPTNLSSLDDIIANSDQELWSSIRNGDSAAFNMFVERYWKMLYNEAYKRLPVEETCKELIQEIFVSLWRKRGELSIENHEAYLRTAIRYRVYTYYSRNKLTQTFLEPFESISDPSTHAENKLNFSDLRMLVRAWIDTLPGKRRQIFILYLEKHLSTKEIAAELKISQKTVQNQLNRSMGDLRSRLSGLQSTLLLFV